ncbi:hypothetical protein [Mycobacterium canetti]|uniref:hypothetical protein n=1 Tax=Mycobacterium canetti TaxID=78331 RepID=UPI001E532CB1|nr:hypothetical protein [Mycobacterium canetti]
MPPTRTGGAAASAGPPYDASDDCLESGGWSDDDAREWGHNGNTWSIEREVADLTTYLAQLAQR